jgi:hypothetical protein
MNATAVGEKLLPQMVMYVKDYIENKGSKDNVF